MTKFINQINAADVIPNVAFATDVAFAAFCNATPIKSMASAVMAMPLLGIDEFSLALPSLGTDEFSPLEIFLNGERSDLPAARRRRLSFGVCSFTSVDAAVLSISSRDLFNAVRREDIGYGGVNEWIKSKLNVNVTYVPRTVPTFTYLS